MSKTGSISFRNFTYANKTTLKFQLVNTHVSYANTLRRIILTEVPSVGFRAEILKDGSTSDIKITKNTTAMSNEMLAHRISLVPVHADPKAWNPDAYEFELNVDNTSDKSLDVKVSDIDVYQVKDGERTRVPNTQFFHPDSITKDTCLLAVLKPATNASSPESVAFTAKATVGIGREHIRFSPVCQCSYSYTRDENPEKRKEIFNMWLDRNKKLSPTEVENDSTRKELLEREFETMEAARCYVTDEKGEANSFDFVIESVGVFNPMDILIESLKVAETKCIKYAAFDKGDLPESVSLQPTKKEARGFDIYFQNEDHTLGNLLTTWLDDNYLDPNGLRENTIQYCGYCVPHPLRDEMLMTIIAKDDLVCKTAIAQAAINLAKMFKGWRETLLSVRTR
jgi:DNA-directed RNA polymerase subunit L/DNA-directed RNA polymerase alpha subunit